MARILQTRRKTQNNQSVKQTLIPSSLTHECIVPNFVEIISGFGEEDFKISLVYFHYFCIFSIQKKLRLPDYRNLFNSIHLKMLYAKVEIGA